MSFILDSFDYRELVFLDPTHKFLWATLFICNFLNFVIEERVFCSFNSAFKVASVFNISRVSISVKWKSTIIIPPHFGISCDFYWFWILLPWFLNFGWEELNNLFESISIMNIGHIQVFDDLNDAFDELFFFITSFY